MIIKEVTFNSPEHKLAVALRDEVLHKPLGLEFSEEELSEEYDSFHLVAMNDSDEVVACLVLKPVTPQKLKCVRWLLEKIREGRS